MRQHRTLSCSIVQRETRDFPISNCASDIVDIGGVFARPMSTFQTDSVHLSCHVGPALAKCHRVGSGSDLVTAMSSKFSLADRQRNLAEGRAILARRLEDQPNTMAASDDPPVTRPRTSGLIRAPRLPTSGIVPAIRAQPEAGRQWTQRQLLDPKRACTERRTCNAAFASG